MSKFINRTGEVGIMKNGLEAKIVKYRNANDLDVAFSNGEMVYRRNYREFQRKTICCPQIAMREQGHMKIINLNTNPACSFLVDIEDSDKVKNIWWRNHTDGYIWNSKVGYLHRYIMQPPRGMVIDHISGDRADNRKSNLRICTTSDNNRNGPKQHNNTSGFKGVYWASHANKWISQINVNNKSIYLGYYSNKQAAAKAYNEAAIKHFGEFAKLNDI